MVRRAYANYREGVYDRATQLIYKSYKKDTVNASAYYLEGLMKNDIRFHDAALEPLRKAIELDPKKADYHVQMGLAQSETGSKLEAVDSYTIALHLDSTNGMAHYYMGVVRNDLAQYELALSELNKAEGLFKRFLFYGICTNCLNWYRGQVYLGLNEPEKALDEFNYGKARKFQDNTEYHLLLAEAYFLLGDTANQHKEALEILNSDVSPSLQTRTLCEAYLGNKEKALELIPKAYPNKPEQKVMFAVVYSIFYDAENAVKHLCEALKIQTKEDPVRLAYSCFHPIRNTPEFQALVKEVEGQ